MTHFPPDVYALIDAAVAEEFFGGIEQTVFRWVECLAFHINSNVRLNCGISGMRLQGLPAIFSEGGGL